MSGKLRIGTRDSQLAVWQATWVQQLLQKENIESELVYIKSEGDIDTVTPLYALGVQGVFTKTLDAALLNNRIDIAVHSMKDVPVQLAQGIRQAAVLKRASHKDIFVPHPDLENPEAIFGMGELEQKDIIITSGGGATTKEVVSTRMIDTGPLVDAIIATSSIRRIAQWKKRYPHHQVVDIRGNVNTRLRKLKESNWSGAIFAAAGLERIGLRPDNAIDLDWMLPAPAQGAVMVVCREDDENAFNACQPFNDPDTALCTKIEKDFLKQMMGGCSTPISALAVIKDKYVHFIYQVCSPDGSDFVESGAVSPIEGSANLGVEEAEKLLADPYVQKLVETIRNGK
ncbi:MAG TPA: hydroxymethylbilane synthase [Chitinophagaceae bacterium]